MVSTLVRLKNTLSADLFVEQYLLELGIIRRFLAALMIRFLEKLRTKRTYKFDIPFVCVAERGYGASIKWVFIYSNSRILSLFI